MAEAHGEALTTINLAQAVAGAWQQAVFTTFTLGLDFFERAILPRLSDARIRLLLADERHLLAHQAEVARQRLVRHANRSYGLGGVRTPQASHAKMILLTTEDRGRLLVGSGNLSLGGWTSVGELFCSYDWNEERSGNLPAFQAARALLDGLAERGYLDPFSAEYLTRLWRRTPWLESNPAQAAAGPVRHNLDRPLLDQMEEVIGELGEEVEELVALAPFHDPGSRAVEEFLRRLQPQRAVLYIQVERTSADPESLASLQRRWPQLELAAVEPTRKADYLHAKLILAKTRNHAVCLQGSANLSQAALLWPDPRGNVEAVNLVTGPRHVFDPVVAALAVRSVAHPDELQVGLIPPTDPDPGGAEGLRLLWARWDGDLLWLAMTGTLREHGGRLWLRVGSRLAEAEIVERRLGTGEGSTDQVAVRVPDQAEWFEEALGRGEPLAIVTNGAEAVEIGDDQLSNPVFCIHAPALLQLLEARPAQRRVQDLGRLGFLEEEDELVELLRELERTMVVDAGDLVDAHAPSQPVEDPDQDEAVYIAYSEVDYERLRESEALRQYLLLGPTEATLAPRTGLEPLAIQVALRSITDSFGELLRGRRRVAGDQRFLSEWGPAPEDENETSDEQDEEEEAPEDELEAEWPREDQAELQERRWSDEARLRRLWHNFIERFLRGMSHPQWRELVGPEVVAANYNIFTHILQRLHRVRWRDPEYLVGAQTQAHGFVWGRTARPGSADSRAGWLRELKEQERQWVAEGLAMSFFAPRMLVDLAAGEALTGQGDGRSWRHEARLHLRDVARAVITHPLWPLVVTSEDDPLGVAAEIASALVTTEAASCWLEPPDAGELLTSLKDLACHATPTEEARVIAGALGIPTYRVRLETARLGPESNDRAVPQATVEVDGSVTQEVLVEALRCWIGCATHEAYRLAAGRSRLMYDRATETLEWMKTMADGPVLLPPLTSQLLPWEVALSDLEDRLASGSARRTA